MGGVPIAVGNWVRFDEGPYAVGQVELIDLTTGMLFVTGQRRWPMKDCECIPQQEARKVVQLGRLAGLPLRDDGTLPLAPNAVGVEPDVPARQTWDVKHNTQNYDVEARIDVLPDPPAVGYLQEVAERSYPDAFVRVFDGRVVVFRPLAEQDLANVVQVAPVIDIVGPKAVDAVDAALRTIAGEPPGAGAALGVLVHWQDKLLHAKPRRLDASYQKALEDCSRDLERAFELPGPGGATGPREQPGAQAASEVLESLWSSMQIADKTIVHPEWYKAMTHCYEMVRGRFGLPKPEGM